MEYSDDLPPPLGRMAGVESGQSDPGEVEGEFLVF